VDLPSKLALRKVILEMQSQGTTFVLTTHIVEDIMIAQRVIILDKGRKMFDGKREELEKLFGDKRHVDIFFTPGSRINFSRFGRILNSENGFVRLEIEKEGIKSKKFMELLGNDDILDYKITDPGMNYVLSKLFKSYDRRKANKEMD
jgi:ABC-2 type transport system ATP-binding protein